LAWRQEAERAYQLWKARQVADQQGIDVVAVRLVQHWGLMRWEEEDGDDDDDEEEEEEEREEEKEKKGAVLDFALRHLKGDLFPALMDMMQ
jgi:hypothetical protein